MGPDVIHPNILKELVYCMEEPLLIIYQRSGELPADWMVANGVPVYQKDMRQDPGNYRLLV